MPAIAIEGSAQAAGSKSSSYIPGLDGLRAVAFLMVYVAHATRNSISSYVPATFGVTVFFFLSGYLITTLLRGEFQKTGRISLRDFYIRRTLRIFIPMYCAYAVAALITQQWGNRAGIVSAFFYFFNYASFLWSPAFLPHGIDSIWSLSVEEHFYLLFPPLLWLLFRMKVSRPRQILLLLALCLVGLGRRLWCLAHHYPSDWTYMTTECRFDSILFGSLLALWNNPRFDRPARLLERHSGLLAAISCAAIVATMFSHSAWYRESLRYTLQGICLYFVFYFCIAHIEHPSVRWLETGWLRYLGWLSYSLYLIHKTILVSLDPYFPPIDWIRAPIMFLPALAYAIAIRYAVELPLQKLRAKFRHAPPPIAAGAAVEGI